LGDEVVADPPRLHGAREVEVEAHGTQVVAQNGKRLRHVATHSSGAIEPVDDQTPACALGGSHFRGRVTLYVAVEDEPRVTLRSLHTSKLLAELESLLMEVRRRLDELAAAGRTDIVAADEAFGVAGLVQASTDAASKHASGVREQIRSSHGQSA